MKSFTCPCGKRLAIPERPGRFRCPGCRRPVAGRQPTPTPDPSWWSQLLPRHQLLLGAGGAFLALVVVLGLLGQGRTPPRPTAPARQEPTPGAQARAGVLCAKARALGHSYQDVTEAIAYLDEALELTPDDADALALRGGNWLVLAVYSQHPEAQANALADLKRAARLNPLKWRALYDKHRRR